MVFNVYDKSLTRIGAVSTVVSSTWEEKYADKGVCQLVVSDFAFASQLLVPENFIGRSGRNTLWHIKTKEKREGNVWANGFSTNYTLLNDRVYDGLHVSGNVEADLRTAVSTIRKPDVVGLAPSHSLTGSVVSEHTYPTLFKLAKDLCGSADYGFRFLHDRAAKKLLFDVWEGAEVPNAKFSEAFGNLANLIFQQSNTDFKNVAYVGGAGEGQERVWVVCGDTDSTGLDRHEMVVDARDIRKTDEVSQEDYAALLVERGLQKLNEHNQKLSVTFDVDPNDFGSVYSLGDIIYCLLPTDGLKLFVRVIAFEETIERNATSLAITLGTPIIQTIGG